MLFAQLECLSNLTLDTWSPGNYKDVIVEGLLTSFWEKTSKEENI